MSKQQLKSLEIFIGKKIPKRRLYCRRCGLGAPLEIKDGLCSICRYALKGKEKGIKEGINNREA